MKNRIFSLGVMALFAACSVNEMDIATPTAKDAEEFFATIEDASTRVFVDDDLMVLWHADDRVSIFNKYTYNQQYRFTGNTGANSGSFTKVPNDDFITGNALNYVYAIYPYKESTEISNQGILTIDLPATQAYAENSFGIGANTMVSCSEGNELLFKNLCGYIMLKLYGDDVTVTSISIKGNNNEPLAGKATVNATVDNAPSLTFDASATKEITLTFDTPVTLGTTSENATTFWLVVPPTTFSKGITLTVCDDNGVFEKSTTKQLEIRRNTLSRMAPLQIAFPKPSDPIIFYDIIAKYACVERFDTNGDGEVSYEEAENAQSLDGLFTNWASVKRFDEIKYFTSINSTIGVFNDLSNLECITIPDNITSLGTFKNCTSLTTVTLPSALSSLPNYCFDGCSSLTEVMLPANITAIPDYCFRNCTSIETMNLPSSLKTIGNYGFSGCKNLSIIIPDNLTLIGDYAFSDCSALTSAVIEQCQSVGQYAFSGCSSLTTVVLPVNMTTIPKGLFYNCFKLANITWPNELNTIESRAFYVCPFADNNYTLELPSTITRIESQAIGGGLRHLLIPSNSFVSIASDSFIGKAITSNNVPCMFIYVPASMVDMYKVRTNWSVYASTIRPLSDYPVELVDTGSIGEAIDLGLSVKWASWNVGAASSEEYGSYFAWGETSIKWDYDDSTYKWWEYDYNSYSITIYKYNTKSSYGTIDNRIILEAEDDAATTKWGDKWRTPTIEEWMELTEKCSWTWTTINGTNGYLVSSTTTGNSIFLPAAGYHYFDTLDFSSQRGFYWSSSLRTESPNHAWYLSFVSSKIEKYYNGRLWGHSIRPVYVE